MKKNIKVIIGIIVGMVIGAASGIGVYATLTYSAGDIAYTKSGSSTSISVASALNELYQNKKETTDDVKNVTANGSITLDKYYKNVNVNVPIPAGYIQPSGTKTITTKSNNIDVSSYQYADTTGMYTADEYAAKTGEGTDWMQGSFKISNLTGHFTANIGFEPKTLYIFGYELDGTKNIIYYDGDHFISFFETAKAATDVDSYFEVTSTGFRSAMPWSDYKGYTFYYLASCK